jgi:hypothetical protein
MNEKIKEILHNYIVAKEITFSEDGEEYDTEVLEVKKPFELEKELNTLLKESNEEAVRGFAKIVDTKAIHDAWYMDKLIKQHLSNGSAKPNDTTGKITIPADKVGEATNDTTEEIREVVQEYPDGSKMVKVTHIVELETIKSVLLGFLCMLLAERGKPNDTTK